MNGFWGRGNIISNIRVCLHSRFWRLFHDMICFTKELSIIWWKIENSHQNRIFYEIWNISTIAAAAGNCYANLYSNLNINFTVTQITTLLNLILSYLSMYGNNFQRRQALVVKVDAKLLEINCISKHAPKFQIVVNSVYIFIQYGLYQYTSCKTHIQILPSRIPN